MTARLGLRFGVTYAAVAGVLFATYAFPFELFGAQRDWLEGYLEFFAWLSGAALGLVDQGVSVTGTVISGRFPLQIVRNCDAAEINILFGSAVLAFPAPFARRLACLGVGLTLLVGTNVLRICSLYFVGVYRTSWFKVAHEEMWPLVMVVVATLLFLQATRYLQGAAREGAS